MSNGNIAGTSASEIIEDARVIFDNYLQATPSSTFVRAKPLGPANYLYPDPTVQTDMAVFSVVFSCVWDALRDKAMFGGCYQHKPKAFEHLREIITTRPDNRRAGFWAQDDAGTSFSPVQVWGPEEARSLCRTLRNGFSHFNFRYSNVKPNEYFARHRIAVPSVVEDPDVADNYRIFIYDVLPKRTFGDPGSGSRLVAVQFAALRYWLFRFLAALFAEPGYPPYQDILNLSPLS